MDMDAKSVLEDMEKFPLHRICEKKLFWFYKVVRKILRILVHLKSGPILVVLRTLMVYENSKYSKWIWMHILC